MDIGYSIKEGVARARKNWHLIFLIFGANFLLAALVALPLAGLITSALDGRGFSRDLASKFDFEIWMDVLEKIGPTIQSYLFPQIFWIAGVYLIWKVVLSLGLINRLKEEPGGFWEGAGKFFFRGMGLGLIYFVLTILAIVSSFVLMGIVGSGAGEVGIFWIFFVALPTLIITLVSILDLMHDYARIHLVERNAGVMSSFIKGLAWPFKNGSASWLYVFWFLVSAIAWALPFVFDVNTASATGLSILLLLMVQQLMLLLKSAFSVAWFGSEVAFYEKRMPEKAPESRIQVLEGASDFNPQSAEIEDEIEYIDSPIPENRELRGYGNEELGEDGLA